MVQTDDIQCYAVTTDTTDSSENIKTSEKNQKHLFESLIEMFDSACSSGMSGVRGRWHDSVSVNNVHIHGFNGSTSGPTESGRNSDGKREYYVPDMEGSNLVLHSANAFAQDGAAILLPDSGFVLRLDDEERQRLVQYLKQFKSTFQLNVVNRTYRINRASSETACASVENQPE